MVNLWVCVMTADGHVFRGSPLIGAARQSLPPGELVGGASWLEGLAGGLWSVRN